MKLLLTSAGIRNQTIAGALAALLGKPASVTKIAIVPTAANAQAGNKDWFINQFLYFREYGYDYLDIVDPSAADIDWRERLAAADVIFVSGGNTFHLLNQVRETGFDEWLNENKDKKIYVGVSAGTIITSPTIDVANLGPNPDNNSANITDTSGLGWVNFEIEPHCDEARFAVVEEYAKTRPQPVYAIDDQTAIKVTDGKAEIISEGAWKVFNEA